jgi:hypothetical protein
VPFTKVLLVSRSLRQSTELFRMVTEFHRRLGSLFLKRKTSEELLLSNHSRIVCLPCKEETIRGYAHVTLLVIDEAARVPDDLYRAVRPMLAVSGGRLICLSTPYGKRGFFHDAWARGGSDWARIEVPADRIKRITLKFLEEELRALGDSWFLQEYCCSFEALEGLVYPDFARCVVPALPAHLQGGHPSSGPSGRPAQGQPYIAAFNWGVAKPGHPAHQGGENREVLPSPERTEVLCARGIPRFGGIDFGFRNPFAAVWGILDRDGTLWLTGEHYSRQKPLSYHAQHLPRDVTWYADPSGATERCELRLAGFVVREGNNALRPGIAAVSARL